MFAISFMARPVGRGLFIFLGIFCNLSGSWVLRKDNVWRLDEGFVYGDNCFVGMCLS